MNLAPVETAIVARVKADTGAGGIWAAGNTLVTDVCAALASGTAYPYLAFKVYTAGAQDGFKLNMLNVEFQLHLVMDVQAAADQFDKGEAILGRLYGDGQRAPAYGFHRHTLVLASGNFTGNVCEFVSRDEDHDDEILHWITTFKTVVSQAAA